MRNPYGLRDAPIPPPIDTTPIPIDFGPDGGGLDPGWGGSEVSPPILNLPWINPGVPSPSPGQYGIQPGTPPAVSSGGTPGTGISPLLLIGGGLLLFFAMKGKR